MTLEGGPVIVRVYNNNLVLARDAGGEQVILMGRAIGYARSPGQPVDENVVEMRFYPEGAERIERLAGMLAGASVDQLSLARQMVELAHDRLGLRQGQALLVPLVDHLVFAVRRAREGANLEIPLGWEVRQLYPREVEVGTECVRLIEHALDVRLPADEAVAFALHFVNSQLASPDIARAMAMTELIARVLDVVSQASGRALRRDSVAVARFVAHLRYLFSRLQRPHQMVAAASLLDVVSQVHPQALPIARSVANELVQGCSRPLADDEVAYLALHVGRLLTDDATI